MSQKARLTLCAAAVLYLAGDFFLFHGPLPRAIQGFSPDSPQSVEKARKEGVIARVGNRPISASQLERAVCERLWLEGKVFANLPPAEQKAVRKAALDELIERELLLSEIKGQEQPVEIPAAEIDERLKSFSARFESKDVLATALKSQGIPSEKALRDRLAAHLREEKFLAARIATSAKISDEEAKKWFTEHEKELATPERVEARHLFIPTLQTPAEEAKKKLDEALAQLTAKQKDFPTLAKEISQDPSSKDQGGHLGWMTRSRLSPDLAEPLFSLPPNQPALLRTRLGWHLIEVTGRKPAEPRTFEAAKAEVLAALEAVKRRDAVKAYRENLRKSATSVKILDPDLAA